jgi:hypothetical protein
MINGRLSAMRIEQCSQRGDGIYRMSFSLFENNFFATMGQASPPQAMVNVMVRPMPPFDAGGPAV